MRKFHLCLAFLVVRAKLQMTLVMRNECVRLFVQYNVPNLGLLCYKLHNGLFGYFFRKNSIKSNDSNLGNWDLKKISSKNLELFFLTYITCMGFFFIVKSSIRIYKIWKDGKLNSSLDTFFCLRTSMRKDVEVFLLVSVVTPEFL